MSWDEKIEDAQEFLDQNARIVWYEWREVGPSRQVQVEVSTYARDCVLLQRARHSHIEYDSDADALAAYLLMNWAHALPPDTD